MTVKKSRLPPNEAEVLYPTTSNDDETSSVSVGHNAVVLTKNTL